MALEVDRPLSPTSTTQDENIHPGESTKAPLTLREKIAAKLAALGKAKPLNLSQGPPAAAGEELVLEPAEEKPVVIDKATKWLAEKAHIQPVAVPLPTTSPKTPRSGRKRLPLAKSEQIKQELSEKLRIRRQEEQQQRFAIYNADNEIDDEPEEDELSSDEEKEDEEEKEVTSTEAPKKKFIVNEDEEMVEVDEEAEEDPEKAESGDETGSDDDEEWSKPKDSEADDHEDDESPSKPTRVYLSDDEEPMDGDDNQDYMPVSTTSNKPARLIDSDDDESDAEEPPKTTIPAESAPIQFEPPARNETQKSHFGATQLFNYMGFCTDPMNAEDDYPYEKYEKSPSPTPEPEPEIERPMRILELDEGSDQEDLLNLCSGKFDTQQTSQQTQQTYPSNMDITEFLSDSPDNFNLTPNPSTQDSFEKRYIPDSLDDSLAYLDQTADIVERAYADFNNPELDDDRIVPSGADLDSDDDDDVPVTSATQPRKRRIVEYSDDEEDSDAEVGQRTPMKQAKLFDSDDEEATDADVSMSSLSATPKPGNHTPVKNLFGFSGFGDMDDVFTTEETSPVKQERVFKELTDSEDEEEEVPVGKRTNKFLEDEASLSGDDVDEDDIDEDELGDDYEREEGDDDDMDEDEIRRRNAEHFRKKQDAEEERQLMRIKEKLFADSDLYGIGGNMDRSFRFRMRENLSDADWQALVAKNPALADTNDSEEEEEDSEERQKSMERKKWIMKKNEPVNDNILSLFDDDLLDSPLLALGRQVLHKTASVSASSTIVRTTTTYKASNDSLLRNSSSLAVLMKDITKTSSSSSSAKRPGVFFSAVDKL
uniref:MRC1 domain-containing protein n=1 Tax=Panagrellus redivivus TaxID=6233 RepID=A0A7E4VII1_PANRE